jgi:hypothetical protein
LDAVIAKYGIPNTPANNLRKQWAERPKPEKVIGGVSKLEQEAIAAGSAEGISNKLTAKLVKDQPVSLAPLSPEPVVELATKKATKPIVTPEDKAKLGNKQFVKAAQEAIELGKDFDIEAFRKAAAQEESDTAPAGTVDIPEARSKDPNAFPESLDAVLEAEPTIKRGVVYKPDLDAKYMGALVSLYQGYTDALGIKRAGSKAGLPSTTARKIARAANIVGGPDAPIVKQFEHLHQVLSDIDNARRHIATDRETVTTGERLRKTKRPSIDIDLEAQAKPERATASRYAKEIIASEVAIQGNEELADYDPDVQIYTGLRGLLEEANNTFRAIESAVGRNNLRTMQFISKHIAHNVIRPATGENIKVGGEEMPAVRFSQLYKNYREGTILDMGLQYDTIREELEQIKK